jgi:hypothetical protein
MATHALVQWIHDSEDILINKVSINSFLRNDINKGLVEDELYSVRYADGKKYKAKLLVLGNFMHLLLFCIQITLVNIK